MDQHDMPRTNTNPRPKHAGPTLTRSEAAKLIEQIRTIAAARGADDYALTDALTKAGLPLLEPCGGEAHSNAHIDNCSRCAPRWGFVGLPVKVR